MSYSTGPLTKALNSCLMIHCLLYLDGVYIRMEGAITVGLKVLTLHCFIEVRIRHCGIFIHAVSPSGIDTEWEASQEFLPPLTQLITWCKRRTKITRKMKRAKQSHCYYPNSVARDRLVLAGDVETNPVPNDAKTGRKKSVQNITVKKSCLTCNKTVRLNQKELTCNLCSGSFHYKCEAGKLKLDVNLWNYTRSELPPLSDSFFHSDTELNRSKRSSQYDELEDNDIDSLNWYQSNISGYYNFNIKIDYF